MTQAFNLSQLANNVNTSGLLNAAAGLYNQLPVPNGGTGLATVASGAILVGAGTAAMTLVPAATTNNVLTASGGAWVSAAPQGGPAPVVTIYTSPATWTKSPTLKAVKVTLLAAGGGGGAQSGAGGNIWYGGGGGGGGFSYFSAPAIPGPLTVTVSATGGAGGGPTTTSAAGASGTSSSFGALVTATGGAGGTTSSGLGGSFTTTSQSIGSSGENGAVGSTFNYAGGNAFQAWGFGGKTPATPLSQGVSGTGYGAGGSAATGSPGPGVARTGGSGTAGFIIVEEFY